MGFLKFNKSTPNQSQIIYTDNVRRRSSFSIIFNPAENESNGVGDISNHIQTFEENADLGEEMGNFITDKNGNFMIVTELGANFVYQENPDDSHGEQQTSSSNRWVVFVSAFIILMINMGFVFSFGTLFSAILEEFQDSRASTAAVQSVFTGIGPSSAIVTGVIVQRFGPFKCGLAGGVLFSTGLLLSFFATSTLYLQLSYGVVSALGFSLLYLSANQILSQLFTGQTRFVCLAMVSSAPGVGGIAYPYILDWLIRKFGLNGTFLLVGGTVMNTIPLVILWGAPNSRRQEVKSSRDSNSSTTETSLKTPESTPQKTEPSSKNTGGNFLQTILKTIRYKPFLFLFLGVGLTLSTINIFGILAMDIFTSNGLSVDQSLNAIIVSSASSVPARLIPGLMNRIKGYSSIMTPVLATVLGACGMLLLNFGSTFTENVAAAAVIGVSRGCVVGCMSVVTLKVLDLNRFSTGLGLIFGVTGLITTVMGPVYGFLRDISGSYRTPLLVTTAAVLAGFLFCGVSMVLQSRVKAIRNRERSMSVFTVTRF